MSDRDAPSGAEAPGPGPDTTAAAAPRPADSGTPPVAGNGASPTAAPASAPASAPTPPPLPGGPSRSGGSRPATAVGDPTGGDGDGAGSGEGSGPSSDSGSGQGAGSGQVSGQGSGDPTRKRRRRGSRGGRKRNKARAAYDGGADQTGGDGSPTADAAGTAGGASGASATASTTGSADAPSSSTADAGGGTASGDGRSGAAVAKPDAVKPAAAQTDAGPATEAGGRAAPAAAAKEAETSAAGDGPAKPAKPELPDPAGARTDGAKSGRNRRRRRGGSGTASADATSDAAAKPAAKVDGQAEGATDDRTPELPDPPGEGRPSVAAAARALVPKVPPPRPKPKIGDSIPPEALRQAESKQAAKKDGEGGGGRRKRRRRGGRGKGAKPENNRPVEAVLTSGVELDEATIEKRKGRERKGRPVGRYSMCVHVTEQATQIAVMEGRALIEHYVSRPSDDISQIHGNIYLGRVQNVLPGMEAAFVDIGTPKNAVLYRGDVHYDPEDVERRGQTPRIEDMLRAGQTIVCQVTKNPIGAKGARLTQEVSLPGRFVVLIPNSSTYGISKRLPDDERKRLRQILDKVKPAEHGIIVRTAAQNVTSEEIEDDVLRLAEQWKQIDALAKRSKAPALLYREPDMAVRVIREEFNQDYRNVAIDDPALFQAVRDYVSSISPELADRVELYDPEKESLPLFERYHVHEQLHKALDRKVWLPSGGSLIIEHTEALTVIDVNTGKNVGRSSLEETVFKNNLEAAVEIARQLRLRDIGGIIVIDFIDMERKDNRDEVVKVFREALARDKTRTQVFEISELGLCEMTRKRIGEGLLESFAQQCPMCEGRGITIDEELLPT
ncbi:MAG TPA: Rne/Rng family ribonuclease [Acidimicrobiales bacterium]